MSTFAPIATRGVYFTLYVRDPDDLDATGKGVLRRVGSVRQTSLTPTLETLPAANPSAYGSSYSVPGQGGWSVSAGRLHSYGGDHIRPGRAWRILRDAMEARSYADVVLGYPDGSRREGTCLPTELPTEGATKGALTGSISLKGVGLLSREPGLRFWGDPGSYDGTTWTDKSTYATDTIAGNATIGDPPARVTTEGPFNFLDFSGGDHYLVLPAGVVPVGNEPYTIAGLARQPAGQDGTLLATSETNTVPKQIDLEVSTNSSSDGHLSLNWGGGYKPGWALKTAQGSTSGGEWFAFVTAYDGRRRTFSIRTPGSTGGSFSKAEQVLPIERSQYQSNLDPLTARAGLAGVTAWIGSEEGESNNGKYLSQGGRRPFFFGQMADLRIWGGALSPGLQQRVLGRLKATYLDQLP